MLKRYSGATLVLCVQLDPSSKIIVAKDFRYALQKDNELVLCQERKATSVQRRGRQLASGEFIVKSWLSVVPGALCMAANNDCWIAETSAVLDEWR